jgi:predicted porin
MSFACPQPPLTRMLGCAACVVLASLSAPGARAQSSVVISGTIDMSADTVHTGDPGTGRQTRVTSGTGNASRLTFNGREEFTSDLSFLFALDIAFFGDTGMLFTPAIQPTGLFGRRSVVGIASKRWGELTVGRDYTPAFIVLYRSDMASFQYYGGAGGTTRLKNPRANNGFYYTSPSWSGVVLRAIYSVGAENTGAPLDEGRQLGFSAEYRQGPLLLTSGYQSIRARSAPDAQDTATVAEYDVGGKYSFGQSTVNAGYSVVEQVANPNPVKTFWVGLAHKLQGNNRTGIQFSHAETGASVGLKPLARTVGLHFAHDLSKRTEVYATYGRVWNNRAAKASLFGSIGGVSISPTQLGASPSAFSLGLSHVF